MGRMEYLSRLALGRSAFDGIDETSTMSRMLRESNGEHVQQYDGKGRPINPDIEELKADLRNAQNDVLALVGVVEKKDASDRIEAIWSRHARERRETLLKDEQDKGELLDYVFLPIGFFAHLWSEAFLQRIQIGFYDSSRTAADIFASEWRSMASGGLKNFLATAFPALGDVIAHTLIRLPLIVAVEQITGRLQSYVQHRRFTRKTAKRLYTAISIIFEGSLLLIDMALLPMEFHATAQRLGLAPHLPLFPPLRSFIPWHATSFHQFGWTPFITIPLIKSLTSPAVLLLLHKIIHWDSDDYEIPICSLFTSYRYPAIDYNPDLMKKPTLREDAMGWLLRQSWSLRCRLMRWCGWDMVQIKNGRVYQDELENNTRQSYGSLERVHRSTFLAQLPATRLAASIDWFFSRLLTLPFQSLMLRAIANAFLTSSPAPKTSAALSAAPRLFTPFTGGPLTQLLRSPSNTTTWTSAGTYTSRLGLALALNVSIDTALFFAITASTRHIGQTYYEWGQRRDRTFPRRISNGSNHATDHSSGSRDDASASAS